MADPTPDAPAREVTGPARVGPDARRLAARARPGDVLVIDALDLSAADAAALLSTRPAAIIDAQSAASGRRPAAGARLLVDAGALVLDGAGPTVLALRDGVALSVMSDRIVRDADVVATGRVLTEEIVSLAEDAARAQMGVQAAAFGTNAMARLQADSAVFFDGEGLPALGVELEGRPVVVARAADSLAADLAALGRFLRERRPVIIAEGACADEVTEAAYAPAVVIGGLDAVSEPLLRTAYVVATADDGAAAARLEALGGRHGATEVRLAAGDIAVLAAHHAGAAVIVEAGADTSGEPGGDDAAIGAFLARLVTQRTTAHAGAVAAVYRHRYAAWFVWVVLGLAVSAVVLAAWSSPDVRELARSAWDGVAGLFGGGS